MRATTYDCSPRNLPSVAKIRYQQRVNCLYLISLLRFRSIGSKNDSSAKNLQKTNLPVRVEQFPRSFLLIHFEERQNILDTCDDRVERLTPIS